MNHSLNHVIISNKGSEYMDNLYQKVFIQSFKHDKTLHRTWFDAFVLEKTDSHYVLVTNHSLVIDYNGRKWITKEPAVCFFYPNLWYNVIAMIRSNGIHYYCNIASPSIFDEEALKNIDYDLDVKVDANFNLYVLDQYEYELHAQQMNYPSELKHILETTLEQLITKIKRREAPFRHDIIQKYYELYMEKKND